MMKQILKLDSVGPNTIGGPTCEAINLFYSYFLREYKQDYYNYILINHINSDELQERVVKLGPRQIAVNVKYPLNVILSECDDKEIVKIQTEIIEKGLGMISNETGKISFEIISRFKKQISGSEFLISIPVVDYKNKSKYLNDCYLSLVPQVREFKFYINYTIVENGKTYKKMVQVFSGKCSLHYVSYFFKRVEILPDLVILSGDVNEIQFGVYLSDGECFINNEAVDMEEAISSTFTPRLLSIIKNTPLQLSMENSGNKRQGIKLDFG
jgi:hypothetical protein